MINETLPALQKLKEQGLVRFIGFTGLPLTVYRRILDRRARARALCDTGALSCSLEAYRSALCMPSAPVFLYVLYAKGCRVAAICCGLHTSDIKKMFEMTRIRVISHELGCHSAAQTLCAPSRRVPEGLVDVVLSYCHHTLFDRTLEGLLPYLQGKGVGVINASVLSMGLLTHEARTRS